jgi:hypothetical protein
MYMWFISSQITIFVIFLNLLKYMYDYDLSPRRLIAMKLRARESSRGLHMLYKIIPLSKTK